MGLSDTVDAQRANRRLIRESMNAPLLTRQHELDLARRWRYQSDERALHESMLVAGFTDCTYQPLERRLVPREGAKVLSGNTIYVRDPGSCQERVRTARRFAVRGEMI